MLTPELRAEIEAYLCDEPACEQCRLFRITKAALDEAEKRAETAEKEAHQHALRTAELYIERDEAEATLAAAIRTDGEAEKPGTAGERLAAAWNEDGLEAKAEALLAIAKEALRS